MRLRGRKERTGLATYVTGVLGTAWWRDDVYDIRLHSLRRWPVLGQGNAILTGLVAEEKGKHHEQNKICDD